MPDRLVGSGGTLVAVRIRVKAQHGQFYALAYGREIKRLKSGPRLWFWQPALAGVGATPGAAITDVGKLIQALEGDR